jgi:hypothetical protein
MSGVTTSHDLEPRNLAEQLAGIQAELTQLREEVALVRKHQETIAALLTSVLRGTAEAQLHSERPLHPVVMPAEDVLANCARDVLRVFREYARPLTTPELLEGLVQRHFGWRENIVRHALDELVAKGVLRETNDGGPHRYQLIV